MNEKQELEQQKKKKGISPSAIGMYGKCGMQYKFRYIDGLKIPPGIAMIKGSSYHASAEWNFKQKIHSKEDCKDTDIIDVAIMEFEKRISQAGEVMLTDEEKGIGKEKVFGKTKDNIVPLVAMFAKEVAPDYQPILVEESVNFDVSPDYFLYGRIDLLDDKERIADFKTASKKKPIDVVHDDEQLDMYALAYYVKFGKLPKEVALDVAVQYETKTQGLKQSRQYLPSTRKESDLTVMLNRISYVIDAIRKEVFTPCSRGAWNCSSKWCGYFDRCPAVRK